MQHNGRDVGALALSLCEVARVQRQMLQCARASLAERFAKRREQHARLVKFAHAARGRVRLQPRRRMAPHRDVHARVRDQPLCCRQLHAHVPLGTRRAAHRRS
jgi:hypothetical protein